MDTTPLAHETLRAAIADARMTRAGAAESLGIQRTHLAKILRGENVPGDPLRRRIERAFGVSAADWDPRERVRNALIRAGWRCTTDLARKLRTQIGPLRTWWRGGRNPEIDRAVAKLLASVVAA